MNGTELLGKFLHSNTSKILMLLFGVFLVSCSSNKKTLYSNKSNRQSPPVAKQSKPANPPQKQNVESNAMNEFPEVNYTNCNSALSYLVQANKLRKEDLRILVDKSDYKLSVISQGRVIKEYPVVFGKNPNGDKLMQGDRRTPEGSFAVRAYYPHKNWEKFIWINYPTQDSYRKHNRAKNLGLIPSNASIGGEIGLHGVPDNKNYAITERQNWTFGCIAMKNQDINELYPFVRKSMGIEIRQ